MRIPHGGIVLIQRDISLPCALAQPARLDDGAHEYGEQLWLSSRPDGARFIYYSGHKSFDEAQRETRVPSFMSSVVSSTVCSIIASVDVICQPFPQTMGARVLACRVLYLDDADV